MHALKQGLNEFWLAWTFLTRLPAPVAVKFSEQGLNRAARFFPSVGLVLGLLQVLVFLAAMAVFKQAALAALLSVMAVVLVTGAFHEDGFADYCDSFGGHDPKSRMTIMTDSRLGTFGTSGLFFMLALRTSLLAAMPHSALPAVIILSAGLSRWLAISLMVNIDYAKEQGKSKPLARAMDLPALGFAALPLVPCLLFIPLGVVIALAVILPVFRLGFGRQLQRRFGGFTGDALGAAQQMAEVLILGACLALA